MADTSESQSTAFADALAAAAKRVEQANAPVLAEPEDDEKDDLDPVLVGNGWVRMTIAGTKHKLRRPFLGDLEALEASIDTARSELTELHDSMQDEMNQDIERAKEIETEANSLNGSDPVRKAKLDDEATALSMKAMERAQIVSREAARLRAEWWKQAFELLTPPGYHKPEQLPAWARDANLQNAVMEHWQSVPLARGK